MPLNSGPVGFLVFSSFGPQSSREPASLKGASTDAKNATEHEPSGSSIPALCRQRSISALVHRAGPLRLKSSSRNHAVEPSELPSLICR